MITLKHLCREFNLNPYPLRQKLRQKLRHRENQRWQWQQDDPQLAEARKIAQSMQTAAQTQSMETDNAT